MNRFLMAPALSALLLLGAGAANAQQAVADPSSLEVPTTDDTGTPAPDDGTAVVTDGTATDGAPTDGTGLVDGGTTGGTEPPTTPEAPAQPLPRAVQSLERNLLKNPGNPGLTNALSRVRANHGLEVPQVQRVERPVRVERPERVERVERPQRPERPERPQRPERVERPERGNGRG